MSSLHKAIDTTLADEAVKIVTADRQQAYDHPENNFARIAQVWNATLQATYGKDFGLSPRDVALMMVGLKLVREAYQHKRDNLVDLIGYTLTADAVTPRVGKVPSDLDRVKIPMLPVEDQGSFPTHPAANSWIDEYRNDRTVIAPLSNFPAKLAKSSLPLPPNPKAAYVGGLRADW